MIRAIENGYAAMPNREHAHARQALIAHDLVMECGAVQDTLQDCGALTPDETVKARALLDRIVAMRTKPDQRMHAAHEAPGESTVTEIAPDTDNDPDLERNHDRQQPTTGWWRLEPHASAVIEDVRTRLEATATV